MSYFLWFQLVQTFRTGTHHVACTEWNYPQFFPIALVRRYFQPDTFLPRTATLCIQIPSR